MEITQEQIIEAMGSNPEIATSVTQHVIQSEKGKEIIDNAANSIYDQRIGDEVRNIHNRYDDDAFEILGERPGQDTSGQKMKTYDFIKSRLTELKDLRTQKESLNESAEVQRLTNEIETLKASGGGDHYKKTYEAAQAQWNGEKEALNAKIQELENGIHVSSIESEINSARGKMKFNPDLPTSVIDAMFDMHKNDLIANSKKEDGKILFLDSEGKFIRDDEYNPASAEFVLKNKMKDVLLTEQSIPGGGAQETINGSIKTTTIEGKEVKSLALDSTKFSTRVEFMKVATDALKSQGIAKSNKDYQILLDKAYSDYNVNNMPRS